MIRLWKIFNVLKSTAECIDEYRILRTSLDNCPENFTTAYISAVNLSEIENCPKTLLLIRMYSQMKTYCAWMQIFIQKYWRHDENGNDTVSGVASFDLISRCGTGPNKIFWKRAHLNCVLKFAYSYPLVSLLAPTYGPMRLVFSARSCWCMRWTWKWNLSAVKCFLRKKLTRKLFIFL